MILLVASSLALALFVYGFILDRRARRRGQYPNVSGRYAGDPEYYQRSRGRSGGGSTDAGAGFVGGGDCGGAGGDCG